MTHEVVPIKEKHISQIVSVHMRSFPNFFLTFLGRRFLKEFYHSFLVDPSGMGFVAEDTSSGDVLGVIVGPLVPGGYFKRLLKRRWWAFCLVSVTAVLRKPWIIKRLFRAMFYRGEAPETSPQRSLLSSIAVDPKAQRFGIGEALVTAWVEEAKSRGAAGCFLTTDAEGNDPVNCFYQRIGWVLESSYTTPEGRKMNRYVLDFVTSEESDQP